ncbi:hypothetical protein ACFL01_03635 [Planctomycetota bacterium]
MYAQDYNGLLPPSLDEVVPYCGKARHIYICPSHWPEKMPEGLPVPEDVLNYSYFGAGLRVGGDPDMIVLIERRPHAASKFQDLAKGWNVLTLDFEAHFLSADSPRLKLLNKRIKKE